MLQNIREKTSGWIAYAIIFLISIPFVLAGITSYFDGGSERPAAIVDGEEISVRQLDFAYANYTQRLRSIFGGQLPETFNDEALLKEQVREQLIEEFVLSQYVENENFRLSDQSLNQKIIAMSVFQQEGRFSPEIYQAQLSSQGISSQQFEQDLRRSEEMTQIRRAIRSSHLLATTRAAEKQSLALQQRKVRSLLLPLNIDDVEVTEDDLEKEYQSNSARYMTPERIKVDYIELNLDVIKSKLSVTEEELKDYYEQVQEDLTPVEIRTASHILLKVDDGFSDDEAQSKKDKALELKQQIINGANFSDLAREHSEDPGSASDGGDLGDVEKGMMVPEFEEALFSLQSGEVSDPVKTSFGWHIIKLDEISGGDTPSYESVRNELASQLRDEMAENRIYEMSESLSNITYEQTESLLPAAEQLGLSIQTSDWFERNSGSGIAANEKVRNLAFSSDVLIDGINSETIELTENSLLVLRLNQHEPSALPKLETIKDTVEQMVKIQKSRSIAAEQGKKGLELVNSGVALEEISESWNQAIKDNGFIERNSTVDRRDIISLAFKMEKPVTGAVYKGLELANGDYAIVEVSEVKMVADSEIKKADKSLQNAEASYEYQAWIKDKVSRSDVVKTPLAELQ